VTILESAFVQNSPRLTPRGGAWPGWLIHIAVGALWVALFVQVFVHAGVGMWSLGIVYIAYDSLLLAFVMWQTVPMTHRRPQPSTSAGPTVGVLIAAYNESPVLAETLRGLLAQTDPPEVIVVADDGSDDDTARMLAAEFGDTHEALRLLALPHRGKAAALNAALLAVDTDVIVTMDADTLPEPGAIGALRQAFAADPALVVAGGVLKPVCGPTIHNRVLQWFQSYEYLRNFVARYAWMRVNSLLLISGAFAGFRREAVLAVGGFDTDCLVEDYELIHRIQRRSRDDGLGWRVQIVGHAVARTDAPGTVRDFLHQRRRWFGGFLQTQYWNRDMTGNPRYGVLGLVMLPVKAADTFQPLYGLAAFVVLIVLAAMGNTAVLVPVGTIVLAKIAIDLCAYVWTVYLYRRWTDSDASYGYAILAAVVEPFTFIPLLHTGALLGWWQFLSGRQTWVAQRRTAFGAGSA
jgi:cellulose synthase/poly-beta-1,6-N-acetylglucosamine synthase-like glycosyltransferase